MASTTSNYNLNLIDYNDPPDIKPISDNFETIDNTLYEKLDKSGGTITGQLSLLNQPIENNHAVNKQYVDEKINNIPAGPQGEQGPIGPQGEQGIQGEPGPAGANGKSAYEAAKEGGYLGTESQFNQKLAEDNPTQTELTAALSKYLLKTGGTITGNLNVRGSLTQNGQPIGGSIIYGTYTGNGGRGSTQNIILGFKPRMVIIAGHDNIDCMLFNDRRYRDYSEYYQGTMYRIRGSVDIYMVVCTQTSYYKLGNGSYNTIESSAAIPSITICQINSNGFTVGSARESHDDTKLTPTQLQGYGSYYYDTDIRAEFNDSGTIYHYLAVR